MPTFGKYDRYTYLYTASKPHIQTIRFNGDLYGRKNKPRADTGIKSADKSAGAHQTAYHLPFEHYRDVGADHGNFGMVHAL